MLVVQLCDGQNSHLARLVGLVHAARRHRASAVDTGKRDVGTWRNSWVAHPREVLALIKAIERARVAGDRGTTNASSIGAISCQVAA
jgi:hypothetical protein